MNHGERGAALVAALLLVAVAAAVSSALATLARTELILARQRDAAARTLAAADACLATAVASLPAGWDFDDVVAGAVAIAPSPDCAVTPRPAPAPARLLLDVEQRAGTARRRVEGVVARTRDPGGPGLLWLGDAAAPGPIAGILTLDGADAGRPGAPVLPLLAAPADPATLDAWLASGAGRIVAAPAGAGGLHAPPPPLAALADRLRAAGAAPVGTLVPAGVAPLALTLRQGDLAVAGPLRGRGLLLVDGVLDIAGAFEFSGVLVATRGLRVASGGRLAVAGAVWLGVGAALAVDGEARVAADGDAVEAADGLLRLPRRAVLAGLRDPP